MRTTAKLGLKVWDSNSDAFNHQDLIDNWDSLEAKAKWVQAGSSTIASGSWTSSAVGGVTYYYKDLAVTFATAFSGTPRVTASLNSATTLTAGVSLAVLSVSTTGFTLRAWTTRNDSPSATADWIAALP